MSSKRCFPAKKRRADELRPVRITRHFAGYSPGSVLLEMGQTKVLCTASLEPGLPGWRKESGFGWVTAEYNMLPGSTQTRKSRPRLGHTDSRGTEIQRLIGRVLRAVVDFQKLGPNTITIDCDVLHADGGTRTASVNGGYIALVDTVRHGLENGLIPQNPIKTSVAAVSVALVNGKPVLDPDYELDSSAEVDFNIAMTAEGSFVELQGSGESGGFNQEQLEKMLLLGRKGIKKILQVQNKALK